MKFGRGWPRYKKLMASFTQDLIDAAASEKEVTLTTTGRKSGKAYPVTIWISTDGKHLYIRSGEGMKRDWPQNFLARGEATLRIADKSVKVRARVVWCQPHTDGGYVRARMGLEFVDVDTDTRNRLIRLVAGEEA